jgi:hypothetical protein
MNDLARFDHSSKVRPTRHRNLRGSLEALVHPDRVEPLLFVDIYLHMVRDRLAADQTVYLETDFVDSTRQMAQVLDL